MAKKKEFNVLVPFEIDGVGRWEIGDPLATADVPAKNLKTLLADGDVEEIADGNSSEH